MDNTKPDKQHNSDDEDSQPQDIRSRIAAFEQSGAGSARSSTTKSKSIHIAGPSASRTAVPHGSYDPLQALSSPPKSDEPVIIRPSLRPSKPSSSTGTINPSGGTGSRVALPGLGGRTPSSSSVVSSSPNPLGNAGPTSLAQSRPWPPVTQPSSSSSDVSSAISKAMDDTASVPAAMRSMESIAKSQDTISTASLSSSPIATHSSSTLATPQLPARKNSNTSNASASTSFSSFTNVSSLTSEPSDLSSRIPPPLPGGKPTSTPAITSTANVPNLPKLPPRRQESRSSASTTDTFPRPPQRTSTVSSMTSHALSPLQSPSSSISLSTGGPSNRASRSSTLQSNTSSRSDAPSLASLPPRPREQSTALRSLPPQSPRNFSASSDLSPAPSARLSTINGSHRTSSGIEPAKRYEELWDKLAQSFGHRSRISESLDNARLDGIVVRQVWKLSKLSDMTLGKIWSQCDVNRQGSLDKSGFCKGLSLIDSELRRRRRSRRS